MTDTELALPHASLGALHRRQRARHLPDLTISDMIDALRKRWWIIALSGVAFLALGVAGTLLLPAGYKTTGFLVVDARRSSIPDIGVISVQPGDPRVPRSEAKVLTAPEFLTQLVDRLKLYKVPFVIEDVKADDPEPGDQRSPAERLAAAQRKSAIDWLGDELNVRGDDRSYAIEVSMTTPDPELSAQIVNGAMALYLERRTHDDEQLVRDAGRSVDQRYNEILADVHRLEAALVEAHNGVGLVGTKAGSITALDLTKLVDEQRENAKQIATLSDSLAHAKHAEETGAWQEIDSTTASPYLLKLLEQETVVARAKADAASAFGAQHPDMIKLTRELQAVRERIHAEVARTAMTLSTQIEGLRQRQTQLASQIEARTQSSADAEQDDERIRQLDEELTSKRQLLATYEMRRQQLASSIGTASSAVRVGAWATVPLKPAGPPPVFLIALAALVGGLLGAAYLILVRRFSDRLESMDEVISVIGLPVLGAVPEIRRKRPVSPRQIWAGCLNDPHGSLAESMRAVLMRIQFALTGDSRIVLVTSAHPGEGKTSLSVSIAKLAAVSGKRVLLVDGDLFQSGASRAVGLNSEMTGDMDAPTVIRETRSGLHLLIAPPPATPLEQSRSLAQICTLLPSLRARYDLIIVDTPPILRLSDAAVLAPHTDAVLFVASLQHVQRSHLIEALEHIEAAGRPILGIALSRVPRHRKAKYEERGYAYRARRVADHSFKIVTGFPDRAVERAAFHHEW